MLVFLLAVAPSLAAIISDSIPIQIQVTDDNGNIIAGPLQYQFAINISNSSGCEVENVLYNDTRTLTTDLRGIVTYNLENVNLAFDEQYYFCYYRNGDLKQNLGSGRTPYAFNSKFLQGHNSSYFMPLNTSVVGDFNFNGGTLTAGQFLGLSNNSDKLDTYDSSYFMPLNTSVFGDFDFNGGAFVDNGLSIRDGNIYAQTAFIVNLTQLGISNLNINGSLFPQAGYDGEFNIGSNALSWKDLWLGGNAYISGTVTASGGSSSNWNAAYTHITTDVIETAADVQSAETDAAHDSCSEISGCVVGAITDGNTGWDNSYGFITSGGRWNVSGSNFYPENLSYNVGIGTSSPAHKLSVVEEDTEASFSLTDFNDAGTSIIRIRRAKGTEASPQDITSGQQLGQLIWQGYGGGFGGGAGFLVQATENWDSSNMGTQITFRTTTNGATAQSDKMIIQSDGDVGIGTSSPNQKLHLQDGFFLMNKSDPGILFYNFSGIRAGIGVASGSGSWSTDATAGDLVLRVDDNDILFSTTSAGSYPVDFIIKDSGNVGIGTDNPFSILDVNATSINWGEGIVVNPAPNDYGAIYFRNNTEGSVTGTWSVGKEATTHNFQILRNGLSGGIGLTRADSAFGINHSSGDSIFGFNVGIGIINPSSKLHVNGRVIGTGESAFGQAFVATSDDTASNWARMDWDNTNIVENGIIYLTSDGIFTIRNNNDTGVINFLQQGNERMRIHSNGNVGIGTTSPDNKLDVRSGSASLTQPSGNWAMQVEASTDTTSEYGLSVATRWGGSENKIFETAKHWDGTEGYFPIFYIDGIGDMYWKDGVTAQNTLMFWDSNTGKVGIGTTSPNALLTVNGAINASGGIDTEGDGVVLKTKVIEIGNWDMTAAGSDFASVAHGLTQGSIRSVTAIIRDDIDLTYRTVGSAQVSGVVLDVYISSVSTIDVNLRRKIGGAFDNVGYDSTGYNRGWVTIVYEV